MNVSSTIVKPIGVTRHTDASGNQSDRLTFLFDTSANGVYQLIISPCFSYTKSYTVAFNEVCCADTYNFCLAFHVHDVW